MLVIRWARDAKILSIQQKKLQIFSSKLKMTSFKDFDLLIFTDNLYVFNLSQPFLSNMGHFK